MSSGIVITPGTFNPPAPLTQVQGVVTWPQPVSGWRKQAPMQWHSVPTAGREAEQSTVEEVQHNFVTGTRTFKDPTAPETPVAAIRTQGVRYAGDATYPVKYKLSDRYHCEPSGPVYTPPGTEVAANFGTVGARSPLILKFFYQVNLVGTAGDPGAEYTIETPNAGPSMMAVGQSGEIRWKNKADAIAVGSSINWLEHWSVQIILKRNGSPIDQVTVAVPIRIRANVTYFGHASVDDAPHEVHSGLTFSDNLYGLAVSNATPDGRVPSIPYASYSRTAFRTPGKLFFL